MPRYARVENEIIPHSIITGSVLGEKCRSEEVCCNDLNCAFVDRLSLQEWELEEWDENHAKFAFFMKTVELQISFGPMPAGKGTSTKYFHCLTRLLALSEFCSLISRPISKLIAFVHNLSFL